MDSLKLHRFKVNWVQLNFMIFYHQLLKLITINNIINFKILNKKIKSFCFNANNFNDCKSFKFKLYFFF